MVSLPFLILLLTPLIVANIIIDGPSTVPESMDWDPLGMRALTGDVFGTQLYAINLQGGITTFFDATNSDGTYGIQVDAARHQVFFVNGSFPAAGTSGALFCVDLNGTMKWTAQFGGLAQGATNIGLNDISVDASGNAYVTDAVNSAIYKVTPSGVASLYLQNTTLWPGGAPFNYNLDGIDFFPGGDWFVVTLFYADPDGVLYTIKTATKEVNQLVVHGPTLGGPDGIVFSPDGTRLVVTESLKNRLTTLRSIDGWRTAYTVNYVDLDAAVCTSPAGQWFGSRYFAVCNNNFAGPSSLIEITFPTDNFIGTLEDQTANGWENFTCIPTSDAAGTGSALAQYQCWWRDLASGNTGHATIKVDTYGQVSGTGLALSGFGSYAFGCNDTYDIGSEYGLIRISVNAPNTNQFTIELTNLKGAVGNPVTKTLWKTDWDLDTNFYTCNAPGPSNFLGLAGDWSYGGNDLALCVSRTGGNSGFPYQITTSYRAFNSDVSPTYNGDDLLGYAVYNVLSKDNTWGRYTECFPKNKLFDVGTDGMVILDDDTILMFWQSTVAQGPNDNNPFGNLWSGCDYAKRTTSGTVPWSCDSFSTCAGNLGPNNPYSRSAGSTITISILSCLVPILLALTHL